MSIKKTILSICMTLLIPFSVAAKKPPTYSCEILVADQIDPDVPFTVTVTRAPSYPGQWVQPTVSVEVVAPVDEALEPGPNTYSQSVVQAVDGPGGSNDATATFIIPAFANLDVTGVVSVFANVSEATGRGKPIETFCEATTSFM